MEEVHRWRGSPEERARLAPSRDLGHFTYFDRQLGHPDWRGKRVLDFGGNDGNLLLDPACTIAEEDYTCIDVLKGAVEKGREQFPRAQWIHYDRYNCSFNPEGIEDLQIPPTGSFDVILAYSVFTHTTREDMHDLVAQLRSRLAPGGALAFTFIDPQWVSWPESSFKGTNLEWRLRRFREVNPSLDVEAIEARARGAAWCALIDGRNLFVESNGVWNGQPCLSYHVYHTVDWIEREFPGAVVRPPGTGQMQHCCILRA